MNIKLIFFTWLSTTNCSIQDYINNKGAIYFFLAEKLMLFHFQTDTKGLFLKSFALIKIILGVLLGLLLIAGVVAGVFFLIQLVKKQLAKIDADIQNVDDKYQKQMEQMQLQLDAQKRELRQELRREIKDARNHASNLVARADRQIRVEKKTRPIAKPKTEKIFYSGPPQDGLFYGEWLLGTFITKETIYMIVVQNETSATFTLVPDPDTREHAFSMSDSFILEAMDIIGDNPIKVEHIKNIVPGQLIKEGGNWKIQRKGELHF